jgi:REP element-mobilizing transposase RayT
VKGRENLLQKAWRDELFKYMSGIVSGKGQKPIIINGVSDHVHAFIGLKPTMNAADLIRDIKNNSSQFINKQKWVRGKFSWQEGYGVFSYGHSQMQAVYQYIMNQEQHHQQKTFKQEYMVLLDKFEVPYEERYLFEWIE